MRKNLCQAATVMAAMLFPYFPLANWPGALANENLEIATFAGGCFWCVESDFDNVPGVVRTVSGYTGGALKDPTYEQVGAGGSGHLEAVQITFDPAKVS